MLRNSNPGKIPPMGITISPPEKLRRRSPSAFIDPGDFEVCHPPLVSLICRAKQRSNCLSRRRLGLAAALWVSSWLTAAQQNVQIHWMYAVLFPKLNVLLSLTIILWLLHNNDVKMLVLCPVSYHCCVQLRCLSSPVTYELPVDL